MNYLTSRIIDCLDASLITSDFWHTLQANTDTSLNMVGDTSLVTIVELDFEAATERYDSIGLILI